MNAPNRPMDDKFRELRARASAPVRSFAERILGSDFLMGRLKAGPLPESSLPNFTSPVNIVDPAPELELSSSVTAPSERDKAFKSLQDFAHKKTASGTEIKFDGGELSFKSQGAAPKPEGSAWMVKPELATRKILSFPKGQGEGVLCAFIGHRLGDEWETYDENEESDKMLERMIAAMKLAPDEYALAPFKRTPTDVNEDEHWHSLLAQLVELKPKIVFLMGANVTACFMGKKERISKLHGQVIKKEFKLGSESITLDLMPIFHPEYLLINTSMKKAAWEDFQKAMTLMKPSDS